MQASGQTGPTPDPAAAERAPERPTDRYLVDQVIFLARCPRCGRDCLWIQRREDTRVRSTMDCDCTGPLSA